MDLDFSLDTFDGPGPHLVQFSTRGIYIDPRMMLGDPPAGQVVKMSGEGWLVGSNRDDDYSYYSYSSSGMSTSSETPARADRRAVSGEMDAEEGADEAEDVVVIEED